MVDQAYFVLSEIDNSWVFQLVICWTGLLGGHGGSSEVGIEGGCCAVLTSPLADLLPENLGLGALNAEG